MMQELNNDQTQQVSGGMVNIIASIGGMAAGYNQLGFANTIIAGATLGFVTSIATFPIFIPEVALFAVPACTAVTAYQTAHAYFTGTGLAYCLDRI